MSWLCLTRREGWIGDNELRLRWRRKEKHRWKGDASPWLRKAKRHRKRLGAEASRLSLNRREGRRRRRQAEATTATEGEASPKRQSIAGAKEGKVLLEAFGSWSVAIASESSRRMNRREGRWQWWRAEATTVTEGEESPERWSVAGAKEGEASPEAFGSWSVAITSESSWRKAMATVSWGYYDNGRRSVAGKAKHRWRLVVRYTKCIGVWVREKIWVSLNECGFRRIYI